MKEDLVTIVFLFGFKRIIEIYILNKLKLFWIKSRLTATKCGVPLCIMVVVMVMTNFAAD